jgi:hypothetical protein
VCRVWFLTTGNGQAYGCFQLNADKGGRQGVTTPNAQYWMPDLSYHYAMPRLDLEVIAIDQNHVDIGGLGGDAKAAAAAFEGCGGQGVVTKFLNQVGHSLVYSTGIYNAKSILCCRFSVARLHMISMLHLGIDLHGVISYHVY